MDYYADCIAQGRVIVENTIICCSLKPGCSHEHGDPQFLNEHFLLKHIKDNGLQHVAIPTTPSTAFIHRMEVLFNAYLNLNSYHERVLGITNDPDKIAGYLSSGGGISESDGSHILSCNNPKKANYWYYLPSCKLNYKDCTTSIIIRRTLFSFVNFF